MKAEEYFTDDTTGEKFPYKKVKAHSKAKKYIEADEIIKMIDDMIENNPKWKTNLVVDKSARMGYRGALTELKSKIEELK
jgi:hypothetical protein